ncbi:antitermination protein [Escherichia coli SHECO003]|nr:antitermination protein [Escherichia coli SHECO003]
MPLQGGLLLAALPNLYLKKKKRITRKLRDGWKRLIDILNQPGVPKNG